MSVWILMQGERSEGSWLVGVFATLEGAVAAVAERVEEAGEEGQIWERRSESMWWSDDVDFMTIKEHTVK